MTNWRVVLQVAQALPRTLKCWGHHSRWWMYFMPEDREPYEWIEVVW